jgi:clan AA aspartic protease
MGHVHVDAIVSARRSARVRFLVDTGATYTVISPALARQLGATPSCQAFTVSLADGRKRKAHACTLGVKIARREAPMTALLIAGCEPLLGVETLEALGLKVDPKRGTLEPTRARTVMLVGARIRR